MAFYPPVNENICCPAASKKIHRLLYVATSSMQATEIHKEFAARRNILQQQLARLQQESRLSVNPLLLQGGMLALPAAGQQQQQDGEAAAAQQPQPAPQAQQQNAAAATAGQVPAVSASLAVAGPHRVTPQGNIILLPDDSIQEKLDKLLAQIEEFTTPRCADGLYQAVCAIFCVVGSWEEGTWGGGAPDTNLQMRANDRGSCK
jgi:hypothetical protein